MDAGRLFVALRPWLQNQRVRVCSRISRIEESTESYRPLTGKHRRLARYRLPGLRFCKTMQYAASSSSPRLEAETLDESVTQEMGSGTVMRVVSAQATMTNSASLSCIHTPHRLPTGSDTQRRDVRWSHAASRVCSTSARLETGEIMDGMTATTKMPLPVSYTVVHESVQRGPRISQWDARLLL